MTPAGAKFGPFGVKSSLGAPKCAFKNLKKIRDTHMVFISPKTHLVVYLRKYNRCDMEIYAFLSTRGPLGNFEGAGGPLNLTLKIQKKSSVLI